ncbi:MAG: cytochrome c3 family protein [Magnetococcales bacterium]|nr:cytochrome c3 family protein [Magnetococcales bacterium]
MIASSNYRGAWLVGGGVLLLALLVWTRLGGTGGTHLSDSRCQDCHLTDQVIPERARMLVVSQEKLCAGCHPKAVQLSHPSGILPGRILPATFPLDWKGELTCSSCHVIHGSGSKLMRSASKGGAFCRECHNDAFFEQMSDRGSSMSGVGHLNARSDSSAVTVELDAYSTQCMTCHDDKGGSAPNRVDLNRGGVLRHFGSSLSHPVGRSYENAMKFGGYHPVSRLPASVPLPNGKVGCVSCHEGYSKKHGGLTVNNKGSALCLTCHDM